MGQTGQRETDPGPGARRGLTSRSTEDGRAGAGRRDESADGPPRAPWGPFIPLRPAGAPHPAAARGGGPAGPAPGRTRSRRALSPARCSAPLPCALGWPGVGVHGARPGKSWGGQVQGAAGGREGLFPAEETGALQQEGLWEDQSPRERPAAGLQRLSLPGVPVASGVPVPRAVSFSAKPGDLPPPPRIPRFSEDREVSVPKAQFSFTRKRLAVTRHQSLLLAGAGRGEWGAQFK